MAKSNGHGALAKPTGVSVDHFGELVNLKFGNVEVGMHYRDAFQFAQWLRLHAKAAKSESGDKSKLRLFAGLLSDAEENYKRGI